VIRILIKIAAYMAAALCVLAIVAYLARDPLRDALIHTVSTQVSKALNGSVEIGTLRGSLVSSIILRDIVVRDQQGTVAQLAEVRVRYNPLTLLKGQLTVQAIDIVEPNVTLIQAADGRWNFQRLLPPAAAEPAPEPSAGGLPFAIKLARLNIRDGEVSLQTSALPGVRHVAGLQLHVSGQIDAQGLQATLHQLTARATPADVHLRITGGVRGPFESLRLEDLRVQTNDSLITADGTLPGGRSPASLAVQMQPFDVGEIGRLLDDKTLHGLVRLSLRATGPPEAVQVQAHVHTEGGSVDLQGQADTTAQPLGYQADLDITHVNLATLVDKTPWQSDINLRLQVRGAGLTPGDLQGQIRLDIQPSHVGDIQLRASQIHLEARQHRFVIEQCCLDTSVAKLSATGELDLQGKSDVQYELEAHLAPLRPLLGYEHFAGTVQSQGRVQGELSALSGDGQLQATALRFMANRLSSLRVTYQGRNLGAEPELSAHVVARQAEIGDFPVEQLTVRASYDGSASRLQFTTEVQQSSTSGGTVAGTVQLTDSGQDIRLDDFRVRLNDRQWQASAPIEVAVGAEGIHIRQFRLVHADEVLEISGGLRGEALQDITLRAEQIDLSLLRQFVQLPPAVDGRATLHVQVSGTLPQPVLHTELRLDAAKPAQFGLQHVRAALDYHQKKLQAEVQLQQDNRETLSLDASLPIDLGVGELPLAQRLPDAPLSLQVQMRQPDLAALRTWLPDAPRLLGTLEGAINAEGTYAELTLDTALQLQQFGLEGTIERVDAPLQLQGALHLVASSQEFAQALQEGNLAVRVSSLELHVPSLRGQLAGGGTPQPLRVDGLRLRADGRLSATGMQATLHTLQLQARGFGLPQTTVQIAGEMTPQAITVSQLHVRLPNSQLRGHGSLNTADQRVQLQLDLPRLRLDDLVSTLPASLPRDVRGVVKVTGSMLTPRVDLRLRYAEANITGDLSAALQERLPRYNATLRIRHLAVGAFLPEQQGHLTARVRLQGQGFSGPEQQATLNLDLDGEEVALLPGLSSRMRVQLRGEAVQLDTLQVRSTPVEFQASGNLSARRQIRLDYRLTLRDLAALQSALGADIQAQGEVTGNVGGALDALQANTDINLGAWRVAGFQGQQLQGKLTASDLPEAPRGKVQLVVQAVQGPSLPPSDVRVEGSVDYPSGTMQVDVTSGPYDSTGLAGKFDLQDGMRLVLDRLRLKYNTLAWENAQPVEIARTQDGTLRLSSLVLRDGQQELTAQGTLGASGDVDAELHLRQIRVLPVVKSFAGHVNLPDGQLTADFTASGTMQNPRLEGSLALAELQWRDEDLGSLHTDITLADQTLQTDLRWQDQGREVFRTQGSIGLGAATSLDLQVKAPDFDLARLTPVVPSVLESSGQLALDLRCTGTLQEPLINGDLTLRDGVVRLQATGERYEDMQIHLIFAGERVDFKQFQARAGDGTLQVSGGLGRAGMALGDVEVAVRADDFRAMNTRDIQAVVSSDVTVKGTLQEMTATGKITVPRARIRLSESLTGGKATVQPWELTVQGVYGPGPEAVTGQGGTNGGTAPGNPLPFLRADLTVDMPRNVWVQGPGMAVELRGNMHVTKELEDPFIFAGTIETVRGFATFYGKKFTLQSGKVTFAGTPEINPYLDVAVTYEKSDYVVTINVTGRTKSPEINLSSDPALEKADIVSLIVLGKTTDRLTVSEQNTLSDRAQEVVGGLAAKQLQQTVGKTLGLDTVEVKSGDKLGSGQIGVGKYITQDIFVDYEAGIGEEESSKVGVEYNLNRRLKLKGSSSTTGETAVDFLWQKDY
jgi:autotransporter translocation and assembly factor TamB